MSWSGEQDVAQGGGKQTPEWIKQMCLRLSGCPNPMQEHTALWGGNAEKWSSLSTRTISFSLISEWCLNPIVITLLEELNLVLLLLTKSIHFFLTQSIIIVSSLSPFPWWNNCWEHSLTSKLLLEYQHANFGYKTTGLCCLSYQVALDFSKHANKKLWIFMYLCQSRFQGPLMYEKNLEN